MKSKYKAFKNLPTFVIESKKPLKRKDIAKKLLIALSRVGGNANAEQELLTSARYLLKAKVSYEKDSM